MRSIMQNRRRKAQFLTLFGLAITFLIVNWLITENFSPTPSYKTNCDIGRVKDIINNLVIPVKHL